jgi:hypothetical protein
MLLKLWKLFAIKPVRIFISLIWSMAQNLNGPKANPHDIEARRCIFLYCVFLWNLREGPDDE